MPGWASRTARQTDTTRSRANTIFLNPKARSSVIVGMEGIYPLRAGALALAVSSATIVLLVSGCAERRVVYVPVYQAPAVAVQPIAAPPTTTPPPAGPTAPPPTVVVTQPPPAPQVEVIPVSPGPQFYWVPGYWSWNGGWVWVTGVWAPRPRPYAVWVQGHWAHRGHGYIWIGGGWR
jgi:hypothetical protein